VVGTSEPENSGLKACFETGFTENSFLLIIQMQVR